MTRITENRPTEVPTHDAAELLRFRRCSRCWQVRPLQQFRFHRKADGIRHDECNKCEADRQRAVRLRRRGKVIRDFNYQVRRKRCPEAVGLLCQELARQFGGFHHAGRIWYEALHAAREAGRHASVLTSFATLMKLIATNEILAPKPQDWSDEELAQQKQWAVLHFVEEHPEVAAATLETLGWHVTPPSPPTVDG